MMAAVTWQLGAAPLLPCSCRWQRRWRPWPGLRTRWVALKAKAFDHLNLEYHHDIYNYLHLFPHAHYILYIYYIILYIYILYYYIYYIYIYIYISHCTNRNQEAMNDFDTILSVALRLIVASNSLEEMPFLAIVLTPFSPQQLERLGQSYVCHM